MLQEKSFEKSLKEVQQKFIKKNNSPKESAEKFSEVFLEDIVLKSKIVHWKNFLKIHIFQKFVE